jgi:hypothetical protein
MLLEPMLDGVVGVGAEVADFNWRVSLALMTC